MNSVMLQDSEIIHKNPLHYHALATKERKIKETIPFTITSKTIKCVWINQPTVAKKPILQKLYDTIESNQR